MLQKQQQQSQSNALLKGKPSRFIAIKKQSDTLYFLSLLEKSLVSKKEVVLPPLKKVILRKKVHYLIGKFVNHLMRSGKKERAEKIFQEALCNIYVREREHALTIFLKALDNSRPAIDVRSVRRGGATYQIPVPLKEKRSLSMCIKWLIDSARKKGNDMSLNLCNTFLEASRKQGEAVKKREALHLTALKNRSLTHFRWF